MLRNLTSILLLALVVGCRHSTAPLSISNPREYSWDATNLRNALIPSPQMWSIWGSSPNDVYACGEALRNGRGELYHFDGKTWSPRPITLGGNFDFILRQLYGFARNDIWAVGTIMYAAGPLTLDSSLVLHYDGIAWRSVLTSHMGAAGLRCLWGTSSNNLYCGSKDGKILHFDGTQWSVETIYPRLSLNGIGGDRDRVFVTGNTFKGSADDSVLCFTKTNGPWSLAGSWSMWKILSGIFSPARGIYYAPTYGMLEWRSGRWNDYTQLVAQFWGMAATGAENILAVGLNSTNLSIYHWDGASWSPLSLPVGLVPKDVAPYGVWMDDNEAFVICNGSDANGFGTSYVLHGK